MESRLVDSVVYCVFMYGLYHGEVSVCFDYTMWRRFVSLSILAEDKAIQDHLAQSGLHVQTIPELHQFVLKPSKVLSEAFHLLGW